VTLHVFRAKDQPATHYRVDLSTIVNGKHKRNGFWMKNPNNRLLHTMCCKKWRPAKNLIAHSYYDGTWFYCRSNKGCKVTNGDKR
jgi:hypothetical protein